jgi:hypothetical protein
LPTLSQSKIQELLSAGESSRLDYKLRYDLTNDAAKNELAKDASAIANFLYQTSGQGYLILGIEDNGNIVGVNLVDYTEPRIQQIISIRTDPPPIFTVHQVVYSGANLVVIELRRNPSGPHQVKLNNKITGFPIRRGSTTDMMTTNEVFQAMQTRGRTFARQRSEYETLSQQVRHQKIIDDFKEGLMELGIPQKSIEQIDINGDFSFVAAHFLRIAMDINSHRWKLHFSVTTENATKNHLRRWMNSIQGFVRRGKLAQINDLIFIDIIYGRLSESYFSNLEHEWSGFIRVRIEPNITYFGCGEGFKGEGGLDDFYLPKFFVSDIKSKEDMKMRVELILKWIEEQQLFNDARTAFKK